MATDGEDLGLQTFGGDLNSTRSATQNRYSSEQMNSPTYYSNSNDNILDKIGHEMIKLPSVDCIEFDVNQMMQEPCFNRFEPINAPNNQSMFQCDNPKHHQKQDSYLCDNSCPNSHEHKHSTSQEKLFTIEMRGQPLICLEIDGHRRLCLAQISSTLLQPFSYNEIHNRRVALGITCVQCTPSQLELLREAGAMPTSSRRCGTITYREAERLVKSFLDEPEHPKLPENFAFNVMHHCGWGCRGTFVPSRYSSSRAKCIRCDLCQTFYSPNKFIFHCHSPSNPDIASNQTYRHPDAANFNAWRRHLYLVDPKPSMELVYAWEDVKAMFNGGNRKRTTLSNSSDQSMDMMNEDSICLDDDEEEEVEEGGVELCTKDANHKRSKLLAGHTMPKFGRPTSYFQPAGSRDNHTVRYDGGCIEMDSPRIFQQFKSVRGSNFLIENVIRGSEDMDSRKRNFSNQNDQGQKDPLNLSFSSQHSKRKRHQNDDSPFKYGAFEPTDPFSFESAKSGSINRCLLNNSDQIIQTGMVNCKDISSNDTTTPSLSNLFPYPPLPMTTIMMNMMTNQNDAPVSIGPTLNNSWPLIFLNHMLHLMETDHNHLFDSYAKHPVTHTESIELSNASSIKPPLVAFFESKISPSLLSFQQDSCVSNPNAKSGSLVTKSRMESA